MNSPLIWILVFNLWTTVFASGSEFLLPGTYALVQSLSSHDASQDEVGYQVVSEVDIQAVHPKVFLVQPKPPKLKISSVKHNSKDGFIDSTSGYPNIHPFIVLLNDDSPELFTDPNESTTVKNLKRGIASLIQFTPKTGTFQETDASGVCSSTYENFIESVYTKIKSNCQISNLQNTTRNSLWGIRVEGTTLTGNTYSGLERMHRYEIDGTQLRTAVVQEYFPLKLSIGNFHPVSIKGKLEITRKGPSKNTHDKQSGDPVTVITKISQKLGVKLEKTDITPEKQPQNGFCSDRFCSNLVEALNARKKYLTAKRLGTLDSARPGVEVINIFKNVSADHIYRTIKQSEYKLILPQILDILGGIQSNDTHQAALRLLRLNTDNCPIDLAERYFWALATSPNPKFTILKEMRLLADNVHKDPKLWQTIVLSLASMTKKYNQLFDTEESQELTKEILELFTRKLKDCEDKDESCRQLYLKALGATESPVALPTLLDYSVNSTRKASVPALIGIWKLGQAHWDAKVLRVVESVLFSSSRQDSSARTVALDILLESDLTELKLGRLISLLTYKRISHELKEYFLQRLHDKSVRNPEFGRRVTKALKNAQLNNYRGLAQGGLSTSFSRHFMANGYLSTNQEIVGAILKRGLVDVNIEFDNTKHTLFSLGLFSSGLDFFTNEVDSKENPEDPDIKDESEQEDARAGMELEVLGAALRPFVFFTSKGELMGHVWSGTASTPTTAFQALLMLEDQYADVPLAIGAVARLEHIAVASVDLSGQIETSLWNRNAQTLVQNKAAVVVQGSLSVPNEFINSGVKYFMSVEPKLDLSSDIDFSGSTTSLCLELLQKDTLLKYSTTKYHQVQNSKAQLKLTTHSKVPVPGRTYVLNQKNTEMCNAMYQDVEMNQ